MYGQLQKMLLKKQCNIPIEIEKLKKETSDLFGLQELILLLDFMGCPTVNSWEKLNPKKLI